MQKAPFNVIIAANNEAGYIGACLDALLAQRGVEQIEVIVAANACTDSTEEIVAGYMDRFARMGHGLRCLHMEKAGKIGALNAGDAAVAGDGPRAYLDADVVCAPDLLAQVAAALDVDAPRYATGTLTVAPARSRITRAYARFWQELPFVRGGAVGAGFFVANAAGRALWDDFPNIISDDTFVRLQFTPDQRVEVPARYIWPMIEGWRGLVRVRRRQDAGVWEVYDRWPELVKNEGKARLTKRALAQMAARDPIGFGVYIGVHFAVRLGQVDEGWARGR